MIPNNTPVVSTVILGLAFVICALLFSLMLRYEPPAPAVTFRYPVVDSGAASYCPGETIAYRQEIRIVNTPATLRVVRAVWGITDERTIIWDEEPDWAVYTAPATVRQSLVYTVPVLGPGSYELRVAIGGEGWRPAAYAVPFTVRLGCP